MLINRPTAGGVVSLRDEDLTGIGLAVVYEAAAKGMATSALRALCSLEEKEWKKLERVPFGEILGMLKNEVEALADLELSSRFDILQLAVDQAHEIRHIIVHVIWAEGGDGSVGYDYRRKRKVSTNDITQAVDGCAEIKRSASWFAMRVANLIEEGVLQERPAGAGMTIHTDNAPVRL